MNKSLIVASAQYPIGYFQHWQDYQRHIEVWCKNALKNNAEFLLFPEYASMELASMFDVAIQQSLTEQLNALQTLHQHYIDLYCEIAKKHKVHIVPGTFPVKCEDNVYRNRAYLIGPTGVIGFQDKLQMTRFENESWCITKGQTLKVFDTVFGKVAIAICYDSEFPLIVNQQVKLGANIILVPSCTDTLAGYNRVKIGSMARALENQCYVVQSVTIGDAPWSPAVDENNGAAAVYTPVDKGFPETGILAMGVLNQPSWVFAELDLEAIDRVRTNGQVFNLKDFEKQYAFISSQ